MDVPEYSEIMSIPRLTFVIWTPPYDEASGGSCALHQLATVLSCLGEDVALVVDNGCKDHLHKSLTADEYRELPNREKDLHIVIYPEIISDNPLRGKHVCRWLLNKPGFFKEFRGFQPEGRKFVYDQFCCYDAADTANLQRLFVFPDKHAFYSDLPVVAKERRGTAFIVRKGANKLASFPPESEWHELVIPSVPDLDAYLREAFQGLQRFVSYDDCTFLSVLAAISGCESIVIPRADMSAQQWRETTLWRGYGIAYGFEEEELAYSRRTKGDIIPHMRRMQLQSQTTVYEFIKYWYQAVLKEEYRSGTHNNQDAADIIGRVMAFQSRAYAVQKRALLASKDEKPEAIEKYESLVRSQKSFRFLLRMAAKEIAHRLKSI
jgi:hypothetical protein